MKLDTISLRPDNLELEYVEESYPVADNPRADRHIRWRTQLAVVGIGKMSTRSLHRNHSSCSSILSSP